MPNTVLAAPPTRRPGWRLAALVLTISFASPIAMAIEEPSYQVIQRSGDLELRQYVPMLVAETLVAGDMDEAGSLGFRRIADYIFGNNQVPSGASAGKIAMTAPVTMEPQSAKIAMTAPVTLVPAEPIGTAKLWRVHFVMPAHFTLESIPKPKNPEVKLREIPGKRYAVLRFTGFNTEARVQSKIDALKAWVTQNEWELLGQAQLARYDPPWTLPLFRRNEVMVEVQTKP